MWKGITVFHSSGALTSDVLSSLRERGAKVASVHPGMTFVRQSPPRLKGVPFGVEGDPAAVRFARNVVRDLGGTAHPIKAENKVLYHAFRRLRFAPADRAHDGAGTGGQGRGNQAFGFQDHGGAASATDAKQLPGARSFGLIQRTARERGCGNRTQPSGWPYGRCQKRATRTQNCHLRR